ncbi:FkbM family methyltransferase [Falsiroseomonas ponticola]|jgi:FkbM family methyltransferase|uniref:FkbM family methyltransferase n=1 Tax=Falsiroseomonas ponticola TaxID=2786951 RepID=UPI00193238C4|nr:FkbM family methyltransferase [Roseomonas ponticola]
MDELTFHTRLHQGGTILDVGAHDGLLTLPFAALPRSQVLAFEPLPSAFARLDAAIRAAHGGAVPAHVALRREALGAAPGRLTLSVPVLDGVVQEQWASAAKDYAGFGSVTVERHAVEVVTIDSLGLHDLAHVKVDAEGFEEEVLRGAAETLRRCRPVLSLEVEERHRAGSTRDVPALLEGLGYAVHYHHAAAFQPLATFDAATMQVASPDPAVFAASDPYIFTFYAWPVERQAEVIARLA